MLLLCFGFAMQLGVVLDNAFPGAKHAGKGLLRSLARIKISLGASRVNPQPREIAPLSVVLPLFLMQLYKIVS